MKVTGRRAGSDHVLDNISLVDPVAGSASLGSLLFLTIVVSVCPFPTSPSPSPYPPSSPPPLTSFILPDLPLGPSPPPNKPNWPSDLHSLIASDTWATGSLPQSQRDIFPPRDTPDNGQHLACGNFSIRWHGIMNVGDIVAPKSWILWRRVVICSATDVLLPGNQRQVD